MSKLTVADTGEAFRQEDLTESDWEVLEMTLYEKAVESYCNDGGADPED